MRSSALKCTRRASMNKAPSVLCFALILCSTLAGQTLDTNKDEQRKAWPQEPEDFKGLKFGMSVDEVRKIMPFGQYACSSLPTVYLCRFPVDPFVFWLSFENGKLANIAGDFDPNEFDSLEEVFVSKYGKPRSAENSSIQNRMGALFQQRELTWSGDVFTIFLGRYGAKLTEGILSVQSTPAILARQKQAEEKKKHILDK
jgi:hypothetical protein